MPGLLENGNGGSIEDAAIGFGVRQILVVVKAHARLVQGNDCPAIVVAVPPPTNVNVAGLSRHPRHRRLGLRPAAAIATAPLVAAVAADVSIAYRPSEPHASHQSRARHAMCACAFRHSYLAVRKHCHFGTSHLVPKI